MKELFPLNTFQQDAVLKRLNELTDGVNDVPNVVEDMMEQGEVMKGYSFTKGTTENVTYDYLYAGACKNGNKITFVAYVGITRTDATAGANIRIGNFIIPNDILNKLYPATETWLTFNNLYCGSDYASGVNVPALVMKGDSGIIMTLYNSSNLILNTKYYVRYEVTFLLSENLVPED